MINCRLCTGSGARQCTYCDGAGELPAYGVVCGVCHGSGEMDCDLCCGTGQVDE
jgi:hypothetical protein